MSERNGKKQTRTLGQQKKGELKWQGTSEGKQKEKQNKTNAYLAGSGTAIRVHINGWPQNREIGGALRSDTLFISFFLSFFLQKVVATLEEAVVLVGKKNPN